MILISVPIGYCFAAAALRPGNTALYYYAGKSISHCIDFVVVVVFRRQN
jgi:hypothetical protein